MMLNLVSISEANEDIDDLRDVGEETSLLVAENRGVALGLGVVPALEFGVSGAIALIVSVLTGVFGLKETLFREDEGSGGGPIEPAPPLRLPELPGRLMAPLRTSLRPKLSRDS